MDAEEDIPRVALLAHRLGTGFATGIGRYYREIATTLTATADPERVRYVLASPSEGGAPEWAQPPLEYIAVRGPRRLLQMSWSLLRRPRVDRSLAYPDLVHTLHPWAPTPSRAPLVVTVHDLMPLLNPGFYPAHHRFGLRRGLEYARDHADCLVVNSEWTAGQLHDHLGVERDRVTVTHFGVAERFREPISDAVRADVYRRYGVEPGRYLITVGAVSARKNATVIIDALRLLDATLLGDTALLLVGPDDLGAQLLREHVERVGIGDRVRFTGYVPDDDLPALLAGSLALVHPSRDEGFGFTPLEAMAAGTAVLAATSGSVPEVVGAAAVLLPPDDATAWGEAIERVATDPEHWGDLVRAGATHQAAYTWERAAAETLRIHTELLSA